LQNDPHGSLVRVSKNSAILLDVKVKILSLLDTVFLAPLKKNLLEVTVGVSDEAVSGRVALFDCGSKLIKLYRDLGTLAQQKTSQIDSRNTFNGASAKRIQCNDRFGIIVRDAF
jgi:hypothetical protein